MVEASLIFFRALNERSDVAFVAGIIKRIMNASAVDPRLSEPRLSDPGLGEKYQVQSSKSSFAHGQYVSQ